MFASYNGAGFLIVWLQVFGDTFRTDNKEPAPFFLRCLQKEDNMIDKLKKFRPSNAFNELENRNLKVLLDFFTFEKLKADTTLDLSIVPIVNVAHEIGFMDDHGRVVQTKYKDFKPTDRKDLYCVKKDSKWGVISFCKQECKVVEVIECAYKFIVPSCSYNNTERKQLFTVQKGDKWGVIDHSGAVIVDFGKYDWIDGYDNGLARCKIGKDASNLKHTNNKWGIINEDGQEVLPVEYREIWNFYQKGRQSTRVEKDGQRLTVYFRELLDEFIDEDSYEEDYQDPYWGELHYDEYSGTYAQDVAGFSDEEIGAAFDGEPDAYWNID